KRGLDKFFKDPRLHQIFAADTDLLSCLVPIGWAYYGDFQSPPQGGGQMIPEWLLHVITCYKGEVYYNSNISEILVEGKTCTGVRLQCRGNQYTVSGRYVVAAC